MASSIDIGRFGLWQGEPGWSPELAKAAEDAGFGTVWVGGSPGGDLRIAEDLLAATDHEVVGTSIVNVWKDDAEPIAAAYHRLEGRFPGRFLLGVGIGHPEATREYATPYRSLVDYLDVLDAQGVPRDRTVLAALGPKVLQLSADRTAGAIPYLTTPEHTARAREQLGPDVLLAPEHKVALGGSRDVARKVVTMYLGLSNYVRNLRTLGYDDADVQGGGSDALVDDLVLRGEPGDIARRLRAHLDAGADHLAVNLVLGPGEDPVAQTRTIATALGL